MKFILLLGTIYGFIVNSEEQTFTLGCPEKWVQHGSNCYKFVDDEARIYEEADAECWWNGATLLSVNDYQEHKFVSDWLFINNAMRPSLWYTSGYSAAGTLLWEGDNTINIGQTYWIRQPRFDEPVHRVVYALSGTVAATDGFDVVGYGWLNVSASTAANYICEIPRSEAFNMDVMVRDFDYGLGTINQRDINRGPKLVEQPENIVAITGVPSVTLVCLGSGNPYPSFSWWRGKDYTNAAEITSATNSRYTLTGGRLTIQDPVDNDNDAYHCRAENGIGTVLSDMARLTFGFVKPFSNIKPAPVYATAFKGVKMECNAPAFSPSLSYQWFEDEARNIFIWPDNPNVFASHSGALYMSEMQPTDAGKHYFCVATLVAGDGNTMANVNPPSRTSLGLLLQIGSGSVTDNNYGPDIFTHAFPSPALRGRNIRLECIAYGTLPMYYSWRREDGQNLEAGTTFSDRSRVLTIPDAPLEAEGNYICRVVRGNGVAAEAKISVVMESKPYFPFPIRDMFSDPGMNLKWHCKAVARPKATYTWYKNGKQLTTVPGQIDVRGNVLNIISVDKSRDEGMYQCAATNAHGTALSTGQLKVLSFAPNFNRFPLPVITLAPLGGNVTIPCSVEAAPIPQVSWLKNGADLNLLQGDINGRVGMNSRYGLVISTVQYSDQGTYSCRATNSLGEASNTTNVRVIDGVQIVRPPISSTVMVNKTAFLNCEASYNSASYDLTYVWSFNGRIIDYKLSPEYVQGRHPDINGLYITYAQYKNTGIYECQVMTTLTSVSRSAFIEVQGPPGAPAGVYADDQFITPTSVRLVWTISSDMHHGRDITGYDIEAETNYRPDDWHIVATDVLEPVTVNEATMLGRRSDQRVYRVEDLIPNSSYRFRVRAVNSLGRGHEASTPSLAVKLPQTSPTVAPRNVGGGGGKVGTLTITWKPLDVSEHCGPNLGYNIYWKRVGDTRDWITNIGIDDMAKNEGMFVATVGEDNYYLQYDVKVGAFNDNGPGPNSTVRTIYSAEGMPISVPILKDTEGLNGTSVMINWEPVVDDREHMKGRVGGYRVYYYNNLYGETPFDHEPDPVRNMIIIKDVYGQTDHAQLIGLDPYSEYFARAQVFNTAGAGPKGEWRRAETANYPLRQFPTFVKVYPRDSHSVIAHWRGVSIYFDEESLQGYILRVYKVQEDIRTATDTVVDKVMEAVIEGLQSHTVYELRVLGFSKAGDGALSEAVYFTVLGGNVQIDPTTSQICYATTIDSSCDDGASFRINIYLLVVTLCLKGLSAVIDE